MKRKVKCAICGVEFETQKPNIKYCSFTCKDAGRRLKRAKWEDAHAGYNAEYARNKRRADKE